MHGIKRTEISDELATLLTMTGQLARDTSAQGVVLLCDRPYPFDEVRRLLGDVRLVIASDEESVDKAAQDDKVLLVRLVNEPETPRKQLSQALLEAIADELFSNRRPGRGLVRRVRAARHRHRQHHQPRRPPDAFDLA